MLNQDHWTFVRFILADGTKTEPERIADRSAEFEVPHTADAYYIFESPVLDENSQPEIHHEMRCSAIVYIDGEVIPLGEVEDAKLKQAMEHSHLDYAVKTKSGKLVPLCQYEEVHHDGKTIYPDSEKYPPLQPNQTSQVVFSFEKAGSQIVQGVPSRTGA